MYDARTKDRAGVAARQIGLLHLPHGLRLRHVATPMPRRHLAAPAPHSPACVSLARVPAQLLHLGDALRGQRLRRAAGACSPPPRRAEACSQLLKCHLRIKPKPLPILAPCGKIT